MVILSGLGVLLDFVASDVTPDGADVIDGSTATVGLDCTADVGSVDVAGVDG